MLEGKINLDDFIFAKVRDLWIFFLSLHTHLELVSILTLASDHIINPCFLCFARCHLTFFFLFE